MLGEKLDSTTKFFLSPEISPAWFKEYHDRAFWLNIILRRIEDGSINEKNWNRTYRNIVIAGLEYQIVMREPEPGANIWTILRGEPMVEGQDYRIGSADGEFGVWSVKPDEEGRIYRLAHQIVFAGWGA